VCYALAVYYSYHKDTIILNYVVNCQRSFLGVVVWLRLNFYRREGIFLFFYSDCQVAVSHIQGEGWQKWQALDANFGLDRLVRFAACAWHCGVGVIRTKLVYEIRAVTRILCDNAKTLRAVVNFLWAVTKILRDGAKFVWENADFLRGDACLLRDDVRILRDGVNILREDANFLQGDADFLREVSTFLKNGWFSLKWRQWTLIVS